MLVLWFLRIGSESFRQRWSGQAQRWLVTIGATAVSTYMLDAVATATGVVLVVTSFLDGSDHAIVIAFLIGTYLVWGVALNTNLRANWSLLEITGTSTNILSKAAHDFASYRNASQRFRKVASGAGYVVTELAKESPYYAGAFGLALLSDTISSHEAIVFLAGANLGAACYEYGLAWGTKSYLGRAKQDYATFEVDWQPKAYLSTYYRQIDQDERFTIAFFVDAMRETQANEAVLFFGVGPTLHHVFLSTTKASEIHLGDFLESNLREIQNWTDGSHDAHDWRAFVRYTLECEGADASERRILEREAVTRDKITKLMRVDIQNDCPLGSQRQYSTVVSAYCVDSITGDRATWELYVRRLLELVRPGGSVLIAALCSTDSYLVDGKPFPSPNVDEIALRTVLDPYFSAQNLNVTTHQVPHCAPQGYSRIMLASGHRRRNVINARTTGA